MCGVKCTAWRINEYKIWHHNSIAGLWQNIHWWASIIVVIYVCRKNNCILCPHIHEMIQSNYFNIQDGLSHQHCEWHESRQRWVEVFRVTQFLTHHYIKMKHSSQPDTVEHSIGIFMCKWDVPLQPQGYHRTSHWYFYVQVGCPIAASRLSWDIPLIFLCASGMSHCSLKAITGHPIGIFMCKWDVPLQPQGYHGTSIAMISQWLSSLSS